MAFDALPSTVFSDAEVMDWFGFAMWAVVGGNYGSRESAAVENGEAGPPSVRNSFSAVPRNR